MNPNTPRDDVSTAKSGFARWSAVGRNFLIPSVKEGEVDSLSKLTEGVRKNVSLNPLPKAELPCARAEPMEATTSRSADLAPPAARGNLSGAETEAHGRQPPENLHDGLGFRSHMLAGAIAGMNEHIAMYPVDTIKTRLQIAGEASTSAATSLSRVSPLQTAYRRVFADGGVLGLYRGVSAMALGAGPAHAMQFAVYEQAKDFLETEPGQAATDWWIAGLSGSIATCVSDAVALPMDVVKQRLQIPGSRYLGVSDCVSKVLAEEGVGAFFKSYRTTVMMNIPFHAVYFGVYEAAKVTIGADTEDGEDRLSTHLLAGGSAGALAAAITCPMDVVKTRLQTQGASNITTTVTACSAPHCASTKAPPITEAMRQIAMKEGLPALWSGVVPRLLFHTPAAAISWATYEHCKSLLREV